MTQGSDRSRACVVGRGVAGMALTIALRRQGWEVLSVDRRADGDSAAGVGLFLQANGVRALAAIGCDEELLLAGESIERQSFRGRRGQELVSVELDSVWGEGVPGVGVGRDALMHVLREAEPDGETHEGLGFKDARRVGEEVQVTLTDGSTRTVDVLIGADGIGSRVRELVSPVAAQATGQSCWRMPISAAPAPGQWTGWFGRGWVAAAIPTGGGGGYLAFECATQSRFGQAARRGDFSVIAPLIAELGGAVEHAHCAEGLRALLPCWSHERVVLVGDAAHASPPNMAQGAALAIEHSLLLAQELAAKPVADALASYEQVCRPRVTWVQQQAVIRARMLRMPPVVREPVMRRRGAELVRRAYAPLRRPIEAPALGPDRDLARVSADASERR